MPTNTIVTIGIPAYNEDKNILNLLQDLLQQKPHNFTIKKIIIVSDGSSDQTVALASSIKDKRLKVIDNKKRRGLASTLNLIFAQANSDILVTLDADIRIYDRDFISKLIKPIKNHQADYTSSSITELSTTSNFAQSVAISMQVKRILYEQLNGGNNIYTSYGLARAYHKDVYIHLKFPFSIGNDMYSYLFCRKNGYRFKHAKNAVAYYTAPEASNDYLKQSSRFFLAQRKMEKYFGKNIKHEFNIPVSVWLASLTRILPLLLHHPKKVVGYVFQLITGFLSSFVREGIDAWEIASTTKGYEVNKKKPQVHVLTKYFYPVAAGIETNILETYSSLTDSWDIHIHTTKDEYLQKNSLKESEMIKSLHVHRYNFTNEIFGYTPIIDLKQVSILAVHNFNLYYWRIFVRVMIDKLLGNKNYLLVVTPHGGFNPEWSMFPLLYRLVKRTYHLTLGVFFLNYLSDKIRTVSVWEKAEMVKCGVRAEKILVIPNGLEQEAFVDLDKEVSPQAKKLVKSLGDYIVQVGRIYPIKNYETVINALPQIPKNIKYLIVGSEEKSGIYSSYKDSLIKLARELGVENRVVFAGVLRGVDKYYVLKHSLTMVHLAKYESYCNVVHEALSQGLVPIVANNTALPYLIKDGKNGYLIDTYDSMALASRVKHLIDHKHSKALLKMSQNNIKRSLGESWSNVAIKMKRYYEE